MYKAVTIVQTPVLTCLDVEAQLSNFRYVRFLSSIFLLLKIMKVMGKEGGKKKPLFITVKLNLFFCNNTQPCRGLC